MTNKKLLSYIILTKNKFFININLIKLDPKILTGDSVVHYSHTT